MPRRPVLISGLGCLGGRLPREQATERQKRMTDLIYVGAVVLFFVVGGLYVRLCEKM
jgi:hypothetical protein